MKNSSLCWISIIIIFILAWTIQRNIFIISDVAWLMHIANTLLNNGIDKNNFYEINTPMSIYIYLPAMTLAKKLAINRILALHIYLFSIAAISLYLCNRFIKKIFSNKVQTMLPFLLAVIFLIVPANQFGQREHLFLMLVMPYLFLVSAKLDKINIPIYLVIITGILASIGFAIKPYFLIPFVLIEFYWVAKQKSLTTWIRMESATIILFLSLYAISIILLQPGYLSQVLPLATQYYRTGSTIPWEYFLDDKLFLFCIAVIGIFSFQLHSQKKLLTYTFSIILFLALIGLTVAYALQQMPSFYRVLPAWSIAILLLSFWVSSQFQGPISKSQLAFIFLLFGIVFSFPFGFTYRITQEAFAFKQQGYVAQFIAYMNDNIPPGKCLFITTSPPFSAMDYLREKSTEINSEANLPYWWLSGILAIEKRTNDSKVIQKISQDKNLLIESIAIVLDTKKPDYIFIDHRAVVHGVYIPFNYTTYFLVNDKFKKAWKSYSYLNHINNYDIYKRDGKYSVLTFP